MGLFSSEYKTSVATSVSRVLENKALPNSVRRETAKAVLQNGSIPDNIIGGLTRGIAVKADSMYAYAAGNYTYGLPTGEIHTNTQGRTQLLAVLQALEGSPVELDYHLLGIPNSLHVAWLQLVEQQGYNPTTNELTALSATVGRPVFLHDMVIALSQTTLGSLAGRSLDKWGSPANSGLSPTRFGPAASLALLATHSPTQLDNAVVGKVLRFSHAHTTVATATAAASVVLASIDMPLQSFDDTADYFQVKYTVAGVTKYWMYRTGTGVYPSLDALANTPLEVMGEFYPIVHFRHGKAALNINKEAVSYKTSKKLAKFIGVDYDQVADAINSNPDVSKIEQAMMIMAVPAVTTNALEQRYLFEFFDRLYESNPVQFNSATLQKLTDLGNAVPVSSSAHTFVIKDALFEMSLSYQAIYKRKVMGSIGAVGSFTSALTFTTESYETSTTVSNGDDSYTTVSTAYNNIPQHVYKRQLNSVSYEEVTVSNLTMTYDIQGKRHTTVGTADDPLLLVPLDSTLTNIFALNDRETLFSRSLHFVINSLSVQEVKWYQTGFFATFILIVAIAIQLYFQVPVATILLNMAASYALTAVLGPKVGALVSIIVGGTQALSNLASAAAQTTAMIAKNLLELASGLVKLGQMILTEKFEDLTQAFKDFEAEAKAAYKTLETAQELLENRSVLSPFVIFGETPTEFYARTVGGGNVGMQAIDGISTYVADNLKLPTFSQSTGGYYYV